MTLRSTIKENTLSLCDDVIDHFTGTTTVVIPESEKYETLYIWDRGMKVRVRVRSGKA